MLERIWIGLPGALSALDDEAAGTILQSLNNVQNSLNILNQDDLNQEWYQLLQKLIQNNQIHALIQGWFTRILFEKHIFDHLELKRLARLALSPANPASQAAAWITGMVTGTSTWLIHQDNFWHAMDEWLIELNPQTFIEMLPLLRRAFASFSFTERRKMADKIKVLHNIPQDSGATSPIGENIHEARANLVLPLLADLLGIKQQTKPQLPQGA